MRDIKGRVENVEVPQLDVAGLVESGERRLRRRRLTAVAGAAAVVLAVGIGVTTWTNQTTRSQEPVDQPSPAPTDAVARPLTFAVGGTIHYGGQTIEVEQEVHMVDVTDDGVVFVRQAPDTNRYEQPDAKELWFTDGSEIVQIGTVWGSPARGYGVTTSDAGSTLVWREPGGTVVFDTESMQVLTRLPDVLRVYDDAVYWVADDAPCSGDSVGGGDGVVSCSPLEGVMRYDVATGSSEPVTWDAYQEYAKRRPRTIGSRDGEGGTVLRSLAELDFDREGAELRFSDRYGENTPVFTDARTGEPIRLRVPADGTTATYFQASHWLDDDSFVLFGYSGIRTELADEGDILTCTLSTGTCRLVLRGQSGTAYQLPSLNRDPS
jgi:hypothetical protein